MVAVRRYGWLLWLLVPLLGCGRSSRSPGGDAASDGGEPSSDGGTGGGDGYTPARPNGGRGGAVHGGSGGAPGQGGAAMPVGGANVGGAPATVCTGGVSFADPDVEAAIRVAMGRPTQPIEAEDLATRHFPGLQIANVSTLGGLECIPALEYLLITSSPELDDLAPLGGLKNLRELGLETTGLHSLKGLGSPPLRNLRLRDSPLEDLTGIGELPTLGSLALLNIDATDLSPLAGLNELTDLVIEQSDVTDLTPLASVTALQRFSADQTAIADLAPLGQLPMLVQLIVTSSQVTGQSDFSGFTAVEYLDLGGNPLGVLPDFSDLVSLGHLYVANAQLSSIDLPADTQLLSLDILDNPVTDISGIAAASQLGYLSIGGTAEQLLGLAEHVDVLGSLTQLVQLELHHADGQSLGFLSELMQLDYLALVDITSLATAPLATTTSLSNLYLNRCTVDSTAFLADLDHLFVLSFNETNATDLAPLVQNEYFGGGASLTYDPTTSCVEQAEPLQALRARGVSLHGPCEPL